MQNVRKPRRLSAAVWFDELEFGGLSQTLFLYKILNKPLTAA